MPKILCTIALFAAIAAPVFSQAPQGPQGAPGAQQGPRPEHQWGREHHEGPLAMLGLSDAQKQQIRQIRESYKGRMDQAGRREMRFEVLSVLTPDQRQRLFAMEEEHKRQHPEGMHN